MPAVTSVSNSGNQDINGLLSQPAMGGEQLHVQLSDQRLIL